MLKTFPLLLSLLLTTGFAVAADSHPDLVIQGEYKGDVDAEYGMEPYGAHVIALGNGKFRVVGYPGGLPGAGWVGGDQKRVGEGTLKDGVVTVPIEEAVITIKDGLLTVNHEGESIGTMKKVERKSPTLGAKPPAGATVLFDGTSAALFANGQLADDKYLGATGCVSRKKLEDHHLHIEFRTPFMPEARGQKRGNSGVYVQSRYEVQVLDSFGLDGKDNECGGIYKVSKPKVNMCYPPMVWQTYDMDFAAARYDDEGKKTKNARITVKHNGVVIHDDLELPAHTPGRDEEGPQPAGVYLQDHGNPVVFQNIWVVEK